MDAIYTKIIRDIKEKSRKGLIAWTPSSHGDTYQANLGKGAIMIMSDDNEYGDSTDSYSQNERIIASLSFLNERGEVFNGIYCFSTLDECNNDLKEIYESAHNSYMQIDETLQSMLDDLNSRK